MRNLLFCRSHQLILFLFLIVCLCIPFNEINTAYAADRSLKQLNSLHELWNFYKYTYIKDGRVISWDENGITTSEGQSYAMLRAVWANDHPTFKQVYQWAKTHLMVRGDHLFAWKWKHDDNSATDADTDIALALLLAWKKFSVEQYRDDALKIIDDIWRKEVIKINNNWYVTAGNWAPREQFPAIHIGYLAPYAYELFAKVDRHHPWKQLVHSSYQILEWLFFDQRVAVPPQIVFINKDTGRLFMRPSDDSRNRLFSYDAFPLYWRIAVDSEWHGRNNGKLRRAMLAFFQSEWKKRGKLFDQYTPQGEPRSSLEALPLYATVQSLAAVQDSALANELSSMKLKGLWKKALTSKETPYYLQNWLWFGRAFEIGAVRNHLDFFDFLESIYSKDFLQHFPWALTVIVILFYLLLHFRNQSCGASSGVPTCRDLNITRPPADHERTPGRSRGIASRGIHPAIKAILLICGFFICFRYLWWRLNSTLNFLETCGPFISISLWVAEFYCLTTVMLLLVQVGFNKKEARKPVRDDNFKPPVDVYIPIYSESPEILEKTLAAACAMRYPNKTIYVLDDSHRDAVRDLAVKHGACWIKGPRRHAKAGNLNNALSATRGDLVVVFDTDHIPVSSFLDETVPFFSDPKVGVVQTPHHFYNRDIFQRAFQSNGQVPNEQDMFNHGIQAGRDTWNGSFFVGSGAVFRRQALEQINGFKLMSITEDIHSSQHLHANGYASVFVDRDLAVGLSAEDYASYIVQRKRWMQGCLQIFFKDNPLFQKGLSLRHRVGYFASLYYFFFPLVRVVFWATPLYYLLFHLHPVFSDVSTLLAYLIPYMICLPLLSSILLQRWPRMLWGTVYENAVSFPLFLSLSELMFRRKLGFKVTPKGVTSDKRKFDLPSAWITLAAAAITLFAILKGIVEFSYFGIEKDAYFFNLGWAVYNLVFLAAALLVAWERPQKRLSDRVPIPVPFTLRANGFFLKGRLQDISLSGASFMPEHNVRIPASAILELFDERPITIAVRRIYQDRKRGGENRCGLEFTNPDSAIKNELLLRTFAAPETWQHAHTGHTQSNLVMSYSFLKGIISCFFPAVALRRKEVRHPRFRPVRIYLNGIRTAAILRNQSETGRKVLLFVRQIGPESKWHMLQEESEIKSVRLVYIKKIIPYLCVAGFTLCES